ncbi:MAG: endonuclease III [Candidatus Aenigmatarchaeota archaeon]
MDKKQKMNLILKFLKKKYGKEIKEFLKLKKNVFKLLVTTILSQRTRDENTRKASEKLFSVASTPEEILKLSDKKLQELIKPSGMYKQKAEKLKKLCKILVEELKGKIPNSREELLKLPGVGNKTADIVLSYGFGLPLIAVDVHVEVCSKRLGLVEKKAKYMEIRKRLEEITPEKERYFVNLGFVKFGQEICLTRNPKCYACPFFEFCEYEKKNLYNRKK